MTTAIEVHGLRKVFGPVEALCGVELTIARGEVLGLLGPNGAGKTTTVEILEGHQRATAGTVSVLGFDPAEGSRELRERIGVVLQRAGLHPALTVSETIRMTRAYYRDPLGVDEVIGQVGLEESASQRVSRLSGGQRRRLELALALVGRPELLFLDEPTGGFDPHARESAWDLLDRLRTGGTTILLTTHDMVEAARLSDRIAVIVAGRIRAEGTTSELLARLARDRISFGLSNGPALDELPDDLRPAARRQGDRVAITCPDGDTTQARLDSWAAATGRQLLDLRVERTDLTDVYLSLTDPASCVASDGPRIPQENHHG
jgi:ABC-2 type transport system ATP-binding protein